MKKIEVKRIVALSLSLLLLVGALCSCSLSKPKTVMSYENHEITGPMYQYWLNYFKAYFLSIYGLNDSVEDLSITMGEQFNNQTIGDFFTEQIVDIAKTYLAGWYLFDEVYKLTLPDSLIEQVDSRIEDGISNAGDRRSFNKKLGEMDLNIDRLREIYIIEEKVSYLYAYLYGDQTMGLEGVEKITDADLQEYFVNNYIAVEHILINTTIQYVLDEDGKYTYDENGECKYTELSEEETKQKEALADEIMKRIENGEDFKELQKQYNDDLDAGSYPDGYLLEENGSYPTNFKKAAFDMEPGEVRMVEESYGRHIIRKLELNPEAYKKEEYTNTTLKNFSEYVTSYIYTKKIQNILDSIQVDTDYLKTFSILPAESSDTQSK